MLWACTGESPESQETAAICGVCIRGASGLQDGDVVFMFITWDTSVPTHSSYDEGVWSVVPLLARSPFFPKGFGSCAKQKGFVHRSGYAVQQHQMLDGGVCGGVCVHKMAGMGGA